MKTKIIITILAILFAGGAITGGVLYFTKTKDEPKTDEKADVEETPEVETFEVVVKDANYISTMKKVSETVFQKSEESISFKDIGNTEKLKIVNSFREQYGSFDGATGKELTNILHKYFGSDQTITFDNIKCDMKHDNANEQDLYIYDSKQGKYVENSNHPGHGGSTDNVFSIFDNRDSSETKVDYQYNSYSNSESDKFIFEVKMMFYDNSMAGDVGPLLIGSAYKSYKDVENKKALEKIEDNKEYVTYDSDDIPHYNLNKVYKNNLDKLDTYVFEFEKENDNLIFTKYYKKA